MLLAILELGTAETRDWFAAQQGRTDAYGVILDWVRYSAAQSGEPRLVGFRRAFGAVMTEPDVAAALAADERAHRDGLLPWVRQARSTGDVRTDLSAAALTAWVMLVLGGFLGRIAADPSFTAQGQSRWPTDAVERLLDAGDRSGPRITTMIRRGSDSRTRVHQPRRRHRRPGLDL